MNYEIKEKVKFGDRLKVLVLLENGKSLGITMDYSHYVSGDYLTFIENKVRCYDETEILL